MPTVLREGPFRVFFYSADRSEPPHVHVERGGATAKVWLVPVRVETGTGFSPADLRRVEALVAANCAMLRKAWDEFFDD